MPVVLLPNIKDALIGGTQNEIVSSIGKLVLDSGCKRLCAGRKNWHEPMQQRLKKLGLKPRRLDQKEPFQFGDKRIEWSNCSWEYPVGIHGTNGTLNIAELECECPGLMSDEIYGLIRHLSPYKA